MRSIIAETSGIARFIDFDEGTNVSQYSDEITGLSSYVVRGASAVGATPTIKLVDGKGKQQIAGGRPAVYHLGPDTIVRLKDGDKVGVGDVIASIPQESLKTRDITGGLPRVADLFEAKKPKDHAVLAEISGTIRFAEETKGKQRLIIDSSENPGESTMTLIPKRRRIDVLVGEKVEKGQVIAEGELNPHDLLAYRGIEALAEYLVKEIQDVYRLQGVTINDKAYRSYRAPDVEKGQDHQSWRQQFHHGRRSR